MEKASGGSFAFTTRKTRENEGRRRGGLGEASIPLGGFVPLCASQKDSPGLLLFSRQWASTSTSTITSTIRETIS